MKNFQLEDADDERIKGYKLARNKIRAENWNKASTSEDRGCDLRPRASGKGKP